MIRTPSAGEASSAALVQSRDEIPEAWTWNLRDIFPDEAAWRLGYAALERGIEEYRSLQGTIGSGPGALLGALKLSDAMGQVAYRVWYYASLKYDEDQRDNAANARRQEVQSLLARWKEAIAWFNPELLAVPLERVREWMASDAPLAVYRFLIEDLYRQQAHVLDEKGERLLSYGTQFAEAPEDAYSALSTADMRFPTITLSDGRQETVTYGRYRAILATNRLQADRAAAFDAHHRAFTQNLNTYATLYHGVLERDWFLARARAYASTLEAALYANNIPTAVVDTLIATTKAGVEPLRRYHRLRRRALGVASYHLYDTTIPLLEVDRPYRYEEAVRAVSASVAPLGADYAAQVEQGFASRWIDVLESAGKRSGAYSAPVYGVHPYMLLNYNDTLDAVFTLAHEMGHSMHTILSHRHQPFVYSSYTIFVAEVPSTLSEALLLEHLLSQSRDPRERIVLLQHAIDGIVSTFFTQVLFADFELAAHRLVEQGRPVTADVLSDLYFALLQTYYGDAIDYDEASRATWSRIPHFFQSPYYVYQYATCFASSAQIVRSLSDGTEQQRRDALTRYMRLLEAGGSDHPMTLLARAGVDLTRRETVQAVIEQLDDLVDRLEADLTAVGLQ